ncbi:MAG: putative addiction module antidote protein [Chloroflexi bacterium]|nr:putative addiction module antidote protein [Chloroflexota bacterium]
MPDARCLSEDEMAAALNLALAAVDPASRTSVDELMGLLAQMARAHRMKRLAQETGLGEKSLYKSMKAGARPEVGTVLRVLGALGFRLQAVPLDGKEEPNSRFASGRS